MKDLMNLIILTIVLTAISYFLYIEIVQEKTRLDACNRYGDLQEFRELCQKQK